MLHIRLKTYHMMHYTNFLDRSNCNILSLWVIRLLVPISIYFCYQHFIIFIQRHMVCTYGFHRFQESYSVKAESCEAHVKHHGWAHAAGYAHVQSVLRFFRQSINRQIFMYSIASPHAKPITRHLVFIINYVSQHVKSITAFGIHHKLCLVKRLGIQ